MHNGGLCCRLVSVRPSVTLVFSVMTAEDIVKLLSPAGSPLTVVFFIPAKTPNSQRNRFSLAQNTCWLNKCANLLVNGRLSRKRYEIGLRLLL